MRIQFLPSDPRAGTVVQMDSSRGQQLIDAGAAVQVNEEGAPVARAAVAQPSPAPAPAPAPAVDPTTLTVPALRAALDGKGIPYKSSASKADLLALLTPKGA
ncbi:HeH/LEM domain-containing protein [uncultured Xylophilus sp.]|uniref:HeH/LEM domain-containing protein n=1 Tax=uncultured Xylophilus sp. TaxID=296832 RepID=UPI002601059E|nr:HeH/LEM domain-containing protein [uncultured Xylophilus sp.]